MRMRITDAEDRFYDTLMTLDLTQEQKTKIWAAARHLARDYLSEHAVETRKELLKSVQAEITRDEARRKEANAYVISQIITQLERTLEYNALDATRWHEFRDSLLLRLGLKALGKVGDIVTLPYSRETNDGEIRVTGIADSEGNVIVPNGLVQRRK